MSYDLISEDKTIVNDVLKEDFALERIIEANRRSPRLNVPPITGIDIALHIFYSFSEIGNKEICKLFGRISSAKLSKLKKAVKDEMHNHNIYSYGMYKINTAVAYAVWGIDVADLEKRRKKLKDLKL